MSTRKDPLSILQVIPELHVGPVRVEPRRITAPYTVRKGKTRSTIDFVYRFEEDVFDPDDPGALNLASMMAAQIAINYGLFCDTIVFHGLYDAHDRRFIEDMAKNTAREILVKKFLEPNPFITGPEAKLPPVKRESYLRAALEFEGPSGPRPADAWSTEHSRHAVLSSGGKDSLLSFALLAEMGLEVHPLYVNESGRHWFTALNAYRHFKDNVPGTGRVWTNSDRVFPWMLRHFPFVRKDFLDVRSDEYPIRLWTVAVFIFGALPLLRKRGLGRLVIGDEYDTSLRLTHQGIPHYGGLYDQSRYFDNAMTRFYQRKGWGLSQFSMLRSVSEPLIQKTLVDRYPNYQRLQVSCHAAHKEGERVHPCGRCEKCRRIVGMLTAFDADPTLCGYKPEQVKPALEDLAKTGIHQEAAAQQHIAFLLHQKGAFPSVQIGAYKGKERPEVMKLRFDPDKAPPDNIPTDLRAPLYRILVQHAEGAVGRSGRLWIDNDPLTDPDLFQPYPYEHPEKPPEGPAGEAQEAPAPAPNNYLLSELSWPQAKERLREVDVALLPVGSTEQHGPHLPLDTDSHDAEVLARQVAAACATPKPLVLPLIPYGVSYHHEDFQGTISISPDTLSKIVYEIGMCVARAGITKLVILNAHGGNAPALKFAAQMINRDAHIFTCVDSGETSDADILAVTETPNDVHAGEIETSTALSTRPHLVRMKAARKFVPKFSSRYLNFSSKRSVEWFTHTARISKTGVMGDPTRASVEKGDRIWAIMIKNLVEFVEDLKGMSLDEIYQLKL